MDTKVPLANRRKIKRKLDKAAQLMTEVRELARESHPQAYVFCEGSGRILATQGKV